MNKFKSKFLSLLTPLAVLSLAVVMMIAAPMTSLMGALRVNAASVSSDNFTITNLPARYAEVSDEIQQPALTAGTAVLWHANREMTVNNGDQYREAGQYEWRFYTDATKKQLITTHTVYVTQPEYVITMPSVVPTVAPKDLTDGKLVLPLPEKLTKDDEEITLGNDYQLVVKAYKGIIDLSDKVTVNNTDDQKSVVIDLSSLSTDERFGTLKVTYILRDTHGQDLTAKVLTDIEIKDCNKDQVTFSSNPAAPSVQSLALWQEITLTAPTASSAKYDNTTFNVEATTKIIGYKFYNGATQPSNWDKIGTVNCASGYIDDDAVKIDGLQVTTKQLGWYKFLFRTDTLFGNKSDNENETDGEYWSDAVNIKSDSRSPEFKFVDAYGTDDVSVADKTLKGVAFADLADEYSDRYPFSSSSSEPASDAQKILVDQKTTLTLPAIFAVDNNTALDQLKMTVTVAQVKDVDGNKVTDPNTAAVYYNNAYHDDTYNPGKVLKIDFANSTATSGDNFIHLTNDAGLYLITLNIEDTAPKYGNGDATSSNSPRRAQKYLYFQLGKNTLDMSADSYSPTIDAFQVSDVYLWEGKTFDFAVPTYSDPYTPTANIAMDYYLVNKKSKQVFRLDNDDISAGRMHVDLMDLMDDGEWAAFKNNTSDVSIYAVARNFTYLQYEWNEAVTANKYADLTLYQGDKIGDLPTAGKLGNGLTVAQVPFTMHSVATGTAGTLSVAVDNGTDSNTTFKAGEAVRIKNASVNWGSEIDGRISVAVYQLKDDGSRVAVSVVDDNQKDANQNENVSAVAFRRSSYAIENWYFTPRNAGTYQVVVTAKNNASNVVIANVQTLTVDPNGEWVPLPTAMGTTSGAPDATLTMGTAGRVVVPNLGKNGATTPTYRAKDRKLYGADGNVNGDYTITVQGVNDPNCLTGERFVPNQAGTYTFAIDYYDSSKNWLSTVNYVVEVTADGNNTTSAIKLDTAYGDLQFTNDDGKVVKGIKNDSGAGTADSPKYAITLSQFMTANLGGTTDFIVDRETLHQNLEKIADAGDDATYQYLYPAIAIPMPNLISNGTAEDFEITVQKSGYSDLLVSSKKTLPNGKNSVIPMMGDYFVFRPEGKFKNNDADFLVNAGDSASAVYVITYKTPSTSLTFNVTIGDPVKGKLTFDDGFLTYDNGKKTIDRGTTPVIDKDSDGKRYVTINLQKLKYLGNNTLLQAMAKGPDAGDNEIVDEDQTAAYLWRNVNVSVTYEGVTLVSTGDWDDKKDNDAMTYRFNLSDSGTYTVNVSLFNPYVNQMVTESFDFTIDVTATNKNVNLSTVWGIILVILSVGLLAGVIFYFVKTARETRFLDNPKAPKAKKDKKAKPSNQEPVKDQKEDVK